MGKRKASSDSESELSNTEEFDSKKHINKSLLQSANLTFKNHFLQGLKDTSNRKMKQSKSKSEEGRPNAGKITQKSYDTSDSLDSDDSSKNFDRKINKNSVNISAKIKKDRKEEVSSSYQSSSEEDIRMDMPFNIKEEKVSTYEKTESYDNSFLNNAKHSLEEENDDLEEEAVVKNISPRHIKKKGRNTKNKRGSELHDDFDAIQIVNKSFREPSGDGADSDSSDSTSVIERGTKAKVRRSKQKLPDPTNITDLFSSQISEQQNSSTISNKSHRQLYSDTDSEKEGTNTLKKKIVGNKLKADIRRKPRKNSQSENTSGISPKHKVNVLQDMVLTPSKASNLREKLEEAYPGLKQVENNIKLHFSSSDDIYLFRIPKTVDPLSLKDVEIDLNKECKINIGEKYCLKPTPKIPNPLLILTDSYNVVQCKGNIKIEKYIKSRKEPNLLVPEKSTVPFPDDLKKRHPLFGPRYKHRIKLDENVERKLDEAIKNLLKEEKPKKKKHRKQAEVEKETNEDIFTLLNSHTFANKIKKEISDDSAFGSSSSIEKMSKKHKKDKNNIINETLKRIKSELLTENESDDAKRTPTKKKKEKRKKREGSEVPDKTITESNVKQKIKNEVDLPDISNHDSKTFSIINSTLMPDIETPYFNPEVSRIVSQNSASEAKPRKHKSSSQVNQFASEGSILERKRKKSKVKEELIEDRSIIEKKIISDVLDSLTHDLHSSKKIKKKKLSKTE